MKIKDFLNSSQQKIWGIDGVIAFKPKELEIYRFILTDGPHIYTSQSVDLSKDYPNGIAGINDTFINTSEGVVYSEISYINISKIISFTKLA